MLELKGENVQHLSWTNEESHQSVIFIITPWPRIVEQTKCIFVAEIKLGLISSYLVLMQQNLDQIIHAECLQCEFYASN